MEAVLWYVLTGTSGGTNRVRVLRALDERPRNAHELAEDLDLHYKTVRHHLDVLMENDVVRAAAEEYGASYLLTDRVEARWDTVEEILETVEGDQLPDRSAPVETRR